MKRIWGLGLIVLGALAFHTEVTADDKKDDKRVVKFDGMQAPIPSDWVEEKPANRMRFLQYKLPKTKDDKEDGALIIFKGLGGSPEQNIARWKAMFIPPDGKGIDDVAKVEKIKIGGNEAFYLDVSGTYKHKDAPFDPKAKEELKPGFRMVNVHYEGKEDQYHIRLVGPAKTVEQYKKGFDDWLKALK